MIAKAVVLALLLVQGGHPVSPFTGRGLAGGGRACAGTLRIYPTYIDWDSTFSTCDHMPYKTLKAAKGGPWTYQFTQKKKACLYEVLVAAKLDDYTWDITGYQSVAAWRKDDPLHQIECGMYGEATMSFHSFNEQHFVKMTIGN